MELNVNQKIILKHFDLTMTCKGHQTAATSSCKKIKLINTSKPLNAKPKPPNLNLTDSSVVSRNSHGQAQVCCLYPT